MFTLSKLPQEQVEFISQFIKKKRENPELVEQYVNPLLREDILTLLEQYCTVIYYPAKEECEEANNGFHVVYPLGEENIEIVYINTKQSREKQIFTAAHELGHIWKIDQHIQNELHIQLNQGQQEQIINRFAAELLMPTEFCEGFIQRKLQNIPHKGNTVKAVDLLHVVVAVMNEYFVPYKAVVLRLYELNKLPEESARILLEGNDKLPLEASLRFVEITAKAEGYSRLFHEDRRKWIEGLKELLDQAEEQGAIPEMRIKKIREQFELDISAPDAVLCNSVPVEKKKGAEFDATASCY